MQVLEVQGSRMAAALCPGAGEQSWGPLTGFSQLQPEETGKREKTKMHHQCRQRRLDQDFIIAQGRTQTQLWDKSHAAKLNIQ